MLLWRELRIPAVMRGAMLVMALPAMGAEVAMAGTTQIVLQWLNTAQGSMGLQEIYKIEDSLEAVSRGEYVVDGHDVGSGTLNVFLYAEDSKVNSAITLVIRFVEQGKLPTGMRIGRAIYADEHLQNSASCTHPRLQHRNEAAKGREGARTASGQRQARAIDPACAQLQEPKRRGVWLQMIAAAATRRPGLGGSLPIGLLAWA
jgi:hypothetical protein